jgi:hypothetical protein
MGAIDSGRCAPALLDAVAGLPDTLTFNRCFGDTSRVSAIDADLKSQGSLTFLVCQALSSMGTSWA